jgi:hypothetical protein
MTKVPISAPKHKYHSGAKICGYSNKSVNISLKNICDIRFKSQLRRVNLNQWIRPFYFRKAAFSGPSV